MVFKLIMAAAKTWPRLKGRHQLPKLIEESKFHNGVEATEADQTAAA